MIDKTNEIHQLIAKAANADKADDAMKFSQAALNAANALCSLMVIAQPPSATSDSVQAAEKK
jgi:hypothetical protein